MSLLPADITRIESGAGLGARGVTGLPTGIHMESWSQGPAPWLSSIQTAAAVALPTASAATSAMGPWGIVAGTGLGMIAGTILDGVDAHDTQKTVALLKEGRKNLINAHNTDMTDDERASLLMVLDLALTKKQRHRNIAIGQAATLQIGRIGTAAYRTGRAIYKSAKGIKGAARDDAAEVLLTLAQRQNDAGKAAREIIGILAKRNFEDLLKHSIKEALRS